MILRMSQIRLPAEPGTYRAESCDMDALRHTIAGKLGVPEDAISDLRVLRRSLDARRKPQIFDVCTVCFSVPDTRQLMSFRRLSSVHAEYGWQMPVYEPSKIHNPKGPAPVIVGMGPAGLFCAYALLKAGVVPVLLERGAPVEERVRDVRLFFETGVLDPSSNVCFGEGGAGTFSDGKLNTSSKDREGIQAFVLEALVHFGAPEHIRWDALPHLGTDRLTDILIQMRRWMLSQGAKIYFHTRFERFDENQGRLCCVHAVSETSAGTRTLDFETDTCVLALGHSARDTLTSLLDSGISMEAKPFAVGFRVEHPQRMINQSQYGISDGLPSASYKLTHQAKDKRGVFSFCMCPGGYVVSSGTEARGVVCNGMSESARSSPNANSAIVTAVSAAETGGDPLSAMAFQRNLEERACRLGRGAMPQQLLDDFRQNCPSSGFGDFVSASRGRVRFSNLRGLLPAPLEAAFLEGMEAFDRRIPGFGRADCILTGIESRTSSPVRILRCAQGTPSVSGLYPCGEGAGFAGGILSAACDGVRTAASIIQNKRENHG